jgi:hypothetical protein
MYNKNYKTLLKEIKEDISKWRHIPDSWIKRFNNIKMSIRPRVIYRVNEIPINIPIILFIGIDKSTLKLIWTLKGCQTAKISLKM